MKPVHAENGVQVETIELVVTGVWALPAMRRSWFRSGDALGGRSVSGRVAPRSPRAAPSTARAPTVSAAAPSSRERGPVALGMVVTRVDPLAYGPRHREARDRRRQPRSRRSVFAHRARRFTSMLDESITCFLTAW